MKTDFFTGSRIERFEISKGEGLIKSEVRKLPRAGTIKLLWHRSYRYYKREASRLIALVDEYANPNISEFIGLQGEIMVLDAFARCQFVTQGREMNSFRDRVWSETDHDLDFIFERDGIAYGVEGKNTLGYMDYEVPIKDQAVCTPKFASVICRENVPTFLDA